MTEVVRIGYLGPGGGAASGVSEAEVQALVDAAVAALIDAAPGALDTLNELAAALGDDANFAATVTAALAAKQPLDADLTALAALVSAANKFPYATGAGAWTLGDISPFARTILDDADAAAVRSTIGAGTGSGTPDAHAASHENGGSDEVALDTSQVTTGVFAIGRLASGTPDGNKYVRDDGTLQVPPGGGTGAVDSVDGLTGDVVLPTDAVAGTGSKRTLGTGAQQALPGNHASTTNARTPTAHATSHENGGSDEVALDASQTTTGQFAIARLASGAPTGLKFVRDDGVLAEPAGGGGASAFDDLTDVVAAGLTLDEMATEDEATDMVAAHDSDPGAHGGIATLPVSGDDVAAVAVTGIAAGTLTEQMEFVGSSFGAAITDIFGTQLPNLAAADTAFDGRITTLESAGIVYDETLNDDFTVTVVNAHLSPAVAYVNVNAPQTGTLPDTGNAAKGETFAVYVELGGAGTVTLGVEGGGTINGDASYVINAQGLYVFRNFGDGVWYINSVALDT